MRSVTTAVGDDAAPLASEFESPPAAVVVVNIEHAVLRQCEEMALRCGVSVLRFVKVEMIARDVGQSGYSETNVLDARERKCVGAHLDGDRSRAIVPHGGQHPVQLGRQRRRIGYATAANRAGAPMVPMTPHGMAAASRIAAAIRVVVVLPFVPVTPIASRHSEGSP